MSSQPPIPSSQPPSIQTQSETALTALQTSPKTPHITPSSTPTKTHPTPDTYTTYSTYDFPDGGRFRINLSGPPFTAFVDGHQGLPDGFLMEINNYIFSHLCTSTTPTPANAVTAILQNASAFYRKLQPSRSIPPPEIPPRMESSRLATAAIMKQLSLLENQDTRRDGFVVKPKEDTLYIWTLQLFFEPPLQATLTTLGHEALELELRFPPDYPYSPPFVRVVAPYVKCRYVLPRGGICMQLFSTSGWTPANSIDAVCVQVRAMLLAGGVEVSKEGRWKYSYDGAKRDLQSAVRQHRWDDVKGQSRRKKMKC